MPADYVEIVTAARRHEGAAGEGDADGAEAGLA